MGKRVTEKRLLIAVVLTLLLGVMLAACTQSGNGSQEREAEGTEAPAASTTAETPDAPKEKAEISVSIYDRGNVPADEGTPDKNRWTEWLNENGPVKVNFVPVPRWEEDQKYNALLASGGAPDIIFTWTASLRNKLNSQNQLMPLDDLIDKYSPAYKSILEKYPSLQKMGAGSDGQLYKLGAVAKLGVSTALLIRADWLKTLHVETPETTEELFDVLVAFADNDPDGNGAKDTYGYHLSGAGRQYIDQMFGAGAYWYLEDGQYIHDWDRSIASQTFKKRLYDANLIDKDYLTDQSGEKALQDFVNGRLGMYAINGMETGQGLQIYETLKTNVPDAQIMAIPLPRSEFGQFGPDVSPPYYLSAVVNAQAKNPEAAMQYIEFLLQESTQRTLKYGIEGIHWQEDANGCPAAIDADKNTQEVDWAFDFSMLSQPIIFGACDEYLNRLNPENPIELEYADIVKQARAAYLSPDRPIYNDIDLSTSAELPEELDLNRSSGLEAIYNIYSKSIVSGASYPMEQALADAKSAWEQAGGLKVDEAVAKWYADNKDSIVLTNEYYNAK